MTIKQIENRIKSASNITKMYHIDAERTEYKQSGALTSAEINEHFNNETSSVYDTDTVLMVDVRTEFSPITYYIYK